MVGRQERQRRRRKECGGRSCRICGGRGLGMLVGRLGRGKGLDGELTSE